MGILLRDSKFWFALYAVAQAVGAHFWPDFPPDILTAVNALVAVIVGALATRGAVVGARARRSRWTNQL